MPAKKSSMIAVSPGIYERGIGTSNPYFQVKIRSGGQSRQYTFPYVPASSKGAVGASKPKDSREVALAHAKAVKAKEDAAVHFHKKPLSQVVSQKTLKTCLLSYRLEACLREGPNGEKLTHMVERKAGKGDAAQILNLIRISEFHSLKNKIQDVMNKKLSDLEFNDFADNEKGLIHILTGRKIKGADYFDKPPATAATKRRAIALLNSMWEHATEHWGLSKEMPKPWAGIKIRATEKKKNTRALSIDELEKVEEAMKRLHRNVLASIYFLRWTAARAGEMQKLRWEHFTWPDDNNKLKAPKVLFEGTKTPRRGAYREREIFLSEGAWDALKPLFEDGKPPKTGIVFKSPKSNNKVISRHSTYQAFVRAVRRAEVPHARLHDLRHTRTTELSNSLPTAQAMVITGHSDPRTFVRYTHPNDETIEIISKADKARRKRAIEKEPALDQLEAVAKIIDNLTDDERNTILLKMLQKKA